MFEERIQVHGKQAKMIINGSITSTVNLEEILSLYVVTQESSLFQGDEVFYVAGFDNFFWVIPYFTSGVDELLKAVASKFLAKATVFRAVSPPLPFAWRRKLLGFCPLFPLPRLSQHPLSTLPALQEIESCLNPKSDLSKLIGERKRNA
jgi:hypothetical protein